jgi:hypothetical protein
MIIMERHVEETTTAGRMWRKENRFSPREELENDAEIPEEVGSCHHAVQRRRREG